MDTTDTLRKIDFTQEWFTQLDEREQAKIRHAINYEYYHKGAGIAGHSDFLLLAKLAYKLTEITNANPKSS